MKNTFFATGLVLLTVAALHAVVVDCQGRGRAFVYQLTITVINNREECLVPLWWGIHTGNFDIFDGSDEAEEILTSLASDGDYGPIMEIFDKTPNVLVDGVVGTEALCSGERIESMQVVKVGGPRRKTKFFFSYVTAPVDGEAFGNKRPRETLTFRPIFQEKNFPITHSGLRITVDAVKTKNRARTRLNGRNLDPQVDSSLGGAVTLSIDNDRQSFAIGYRIKVTRVRTADAVEKIGLHVEGEEIFDFLADYLDDHGEPAETFVARNGAMNLNGGLIEEGELSITNEELWNAIYSDRAIVVVQTTMFPFGEVAGALQITKA